MKRRLLVITSSFPRGEEDIAGYFVRGWAEALALRGHELDILAWRGPGAKSGEVSARVGVEFVPYGPKRWERLFFGDGAPENLERHKLVGLMAAPAMVAMVRAALRACETKRYDAVVGHWLLPGGLVARLVGKKAKIPSFVVGHSGGVHLVERLGRFGGRRLARFISSGPTTVPTDSLREKLIGAGGSVEIRVAPMGFEPPDSGGAKKEIGEELKIGFLGRLVPVKGLEVVVEAVKGLPLVFEIVGDGPSRAGLEEIAGENTRFLGPKFGAEKNGLLREWETIVLPSIPRQSGRHEGLPVSLLEGASAGAVPFVSGVPGVVPWIVRPERQILKAGDVEAWRGALTEFLECPDGERRQWQEESRRLVAPLAWPIYAKWWEKWLEDGLADHL